MFVLGHKLSKAHVWILLVDYVRVFWVNYMMVLSLSLSLKNFEFSDCWLNSFFFFFFLTLTQILRLHQIISISLIFISTITFIFSNEKLKNKNIYVGTTINKMPFKKTLCNFDITYLCFSWFYNYDFNLNFKVKPF